MNTETSTLAESTLLSGHGVTPSVRLHITTPWPVIFKNGKFSDDFTKHHSISGIYAARFSTQSNCHWYVGYSKSIYSRILSHRLDCEKHGKQHCKFYMAVKGYGWAKVEFYLIEECPVDSLKHREEFWSDKLDSFRNGYNTVKCGGSNPMNDPTVLGRLKEKRQTEVCERMENKQWCTVSRSMSSQLQIRVRESKHIQLCIIRNTLLNGICAQLPDQFTITDVTSLRIVGNGEVVVRNMQKYNKVFIIGKQGPKLIYKKGLPPIGYSRTQAVGSVTASRARALKVPQSPISKKNVALKWWTTERRVLLKQLTDMWWTTERRHLAGLGIEDRKKVNTGFGEFIRDNFYNN